jgi:hypothetical protein
VLNGGSLLSQVSGVQRKKKVLTENKPTQNKPKQHKARDENPKQGKNI